MTIDEAIKHCEEVAEKNENKAQLWNKQTKNRVVDFCDKAMQEENDCIERAREHKQLAEWLTDYKRLKEQEPCEDVISRSYALNVINLMKANIEAGGYEAYSQLFDRFDNVPPATPKRKVGEWIKKNNDYFDWYECSECGYGSDGEMKYNRLCDVRTKFCPDCGSQNLKGE